MQIIANHFQHRKFLNEIELSWSDGRSFIKETQTLSYDVEHADAVPREYDIIRVLELSHEDQFPGNTAITSISFKSSKTKESFNLNGKDLESYICRHAGILEAKVPREIKPSESLHVEIISTGVLLKSDYLVIVALCPTIGMTVRVSHPKDLRVEGVLMAPIPDSDGWFTSTGFMKEWKIPTGLLPFQGVQVHFEPDDTSTMSG